MHALAVDPGVIGSARLIDLPSPRPRADSIVVRVLEVGVCGTDREICAGHFGSAPQGERLLILGHELLGIVEHGASGFRPGDLVTATVRRSCGNCHACIEGVADACFSGGYRDRGITGLHGFASEMVCESAANLIAVPAPLGRFGVLVEPASVCERAVRQARLIGNRQPWRLQRALILGAGAIGSLTAALLRLSRIDVVVAADEERSAFVDFIGATYISLGSTPIQDLGRFDLVVEAAGDAQLMAASLACLRRGGVACLIGLDGRPGRVELERSLLGLDTVLGNRVLFGTVSAHHSDYIAAATDLAELQRRWPGALELLIGLRVSVDRYAEALTHRGSKATLLFS